MEKGSEMAKLHVLTASDGVSDTIRKIYGNSKDLTYRLQKKSLVAKLWLPHGPLSKLSFCGAGYSHLSTVEKMLRNLTRLLTFLQWLNVWVNRGMKI